MSESTRQTPPGFYREPMGTVERAILLSLLCFGFALLFWHFPSIPSGLHRDEMMEAYESWSIWQTGADRWGYHLPVYFLSWGSGQNVLQAYLNTPIVAVLGLTVVSVRIFAFLCNVAFLPLFFQLIRMWRGTSTALICLLILVASPWHIMMSRWAVENSPLPFFTVLALWAFSEALLRGTRPMIFLCLVPFVLAIYTYGLVLLAVHLLVALLLWANRILFARIVIRGFLRCLCAPPWLLQLFSSP